MIFKEYCVLGTIFLSFYFATYKRTYARFGSWYFHQMKNLGSYFPGLKVVSTSTRSVPFTYCSGPDRRADSNKDAKTVGGINRFSGDNNAVNKWILRR